MRLVGAFRCAGFRLEYDSAVPADPIGKDLARLEAGECLTINAVRVYARDRHGLKQWRLRLLPAPADARLVFDLPPGVGIESMPDKCKSPLARHVAELQVGLGDEIRENDGRLGLDRGLALGGRRCAVSCAAIAFDAAKISHEPIKLRLTNMGRIPGS